MSTLSISSGSSLGSLGSLSASSRGSLNSLGMDIYGQQPCTDTSLQDLHSRLLKVLQGHANIAAIQSVELPPAIPPVDVTAAATGSYMQSVMAGNMDIPSSVKSQSSHSSMSSISPPVSPYDMGPPPSYEQHMSCVEQLRSGPQAGNWASSNENAAVNSANSNQSKTSMDASSLLYSSKVDSLRTNHVSLSQPSVQSVRSTELPETIYFGGSAKRSQFSDIIDVASNPPLSPISESSSGVCNNLSGGNTRSVSAAVSDESVAGDSGVFEASMNRSV